MTQAQGKAVAKPPAAYKAIHGGIVALLQTARLSAARSVNALMTASYWEIGRRIVEAEQKGQRRAAYGAQLIARLSVDLTQQFGRGFSPDNLENMRRFFLLYPCATISETLSRKSSHALANNISETVSAQLTRVQGTQAFPLPWSAYVRLLSVKNDLARQFYETQALSGGWSVRQLDRQINSQFYERTALSRNKAAMLSKGAVAQAQDTVTPEEAIKDPCVLEFLALKNEYSETQFEEALIHQLENFLLELGDDFAFVGRQKRLRLDDTWFRVDLVFFHRRLRCLVIVDLKVGKFSYADAGQMHLYPSHLEIPNLGVRLSGWPARRAKRSRGCSPARLCNAAGCPAARSQVGCLQVGGVYAQLRQSPLDARRRKPTCGLALVQPERHGRGALRARRTAQQGAGRAVPNCAAQRRKNCPSAAANHAQAGFAQGRWRLMLESVES